MKQCPTAVNIAERDCCGEISGVLSNIPQNIILYNTPIKVIFYYYKYFTNINLNDITITHLPTKLKHKTIHKGTKTTSQLQLTNPSNFKGRKTNCKALTEQNSSN